MKGYRNECTGRLKGNSLRPCLAVANVITAEGSVSHSVKRYFKCFNCIFFIRSELFR